MKVLIFMTQFYQWGGAERSVVELAEGLNKRGIHTDILSMYSDDLPGAAEEKERILQRGIPAVHFLGMRVHPPITSMVSAIRRFRRLIREHEYDIVETSALSPSTIAAWGMLRTRSRHIAGLRDVFKKERADSWRHRFWRFSMRRDKRLRFYAISEYTKRHWLEYSATPPEYTRLVYNSVPNENFETSADRNGVRSEFGLPPTARIALFVGRLLKRKGIDTLCEALCPVLRDNNLYLFLIGGEDPSEDCQPGDKGLVERLRKQMRTDGLEDRVLFIGRRNDVPRLMASSDLLVHPARIEAFGRILAEALAAGLPVVASTADGIPEVLAETESIMVPPDDPQALREAVLKTLNRTPDEAAQAIEKGRRRAEDFRIDDRIYALVKLFEEVLAGRF